MSEHLISLDAGRVEDREAFAGIVRRYQNLVTALTFSMTGNLQQSEDLAQETFVAAWRRLTGGASRPDVAAEKIGPWLCGIARNLTNNWLRRTTRERNTPHIPAEGDAVADLAAGLSAVNDFQDEETEILREMQATLVWETLRHIPANYREPLVMFYRQDASIREIADALGLTEACVKQRISRGRAMLKGEIASRFESFLTQIRPGEHFIVAVLAAIPILATGKQAMAASSAGIAAAKAASSGGGGHPLIAGITTSCWTFLCSVGPFLIIFLGTVLGTWSGVRHAPTRRARLLMLKTALEYYTFCSVILTLVALYRTYLHTLDQYINYTLYRYLNIDVLYGFYSICFVVMPILILLNTIRVNRKWRQIVEFDSGVGGKEPHVVTRKSIVTLLVVTFLFHLILYGVIVHFRYFEMKAFPPLRFSDWICLLSFPTALLIFLYCGWRISRDDAAFEKKPPRLRNLLPILTGEEAWPKGFKNRINFWGDLIGVSCGMVFMQMFSVSWYLRFMAFPAYLLHLGLSLAAYFGFVVFFAGIPRRRYWGMILLAGIIFTCNTFVLCDAKLWQQVISYSEVWPHTHPQKFVEFVLIFVLNAWHLFCFGLIGMAGLYVFRKKA